MLAHPRWIALVVAVAVLVVVFLELSQWQLRRLDQRRAANAVITENADAAPRPVADLADVGRPLPADRQWHPVTARGRYDVDRQLLVRYRYLGGEPGFHVLTPLVTDAGPALLVDRGWLPSGGSAAEPDVPAPPKGRVAVTARLRVGESGDPRQVRPETGQVRFINVETIAASLPYPVYGGYAELVDAEPPPGDSPILVPPPELDEGPHLSYAVQWVLFAVIAVGGVGFLAWDAARGGRLRERLRRRELEADRRATALPPPSDDATDRANRA